MQYVAVFGAMALGLLAISRGLIIEPPAFAAALPPTVVTECVTRRMRRRHEDGAMITGTLVALFRHAVSHHAGRWCCSACSR